MSKKKYYFWTHIFESSLKFRRGTNASSVSLSKTHSKSIISHTGLNMTYVPDLDTSICQWRATPGRRPRKASTPLNIWAATRSLRLQDVRRLVILGHMKTPLDLLESYKRLWDAAEVWGWSRFACVLWHPVVPSGTIWQKLSFNMIYYSRTFRNWCCKDTLLV